MLINISNMDYIIKIIISFSLLIAVLLFARNFNLFNKNDVKLIQNINMPKTARRVFNKAILILSKS